eukprot:gene118-118_t
MTVTIFLGSLLLAMAIGVPIAYALLICGVALMWHLDLFDAQILAQNVINGADSFPLLAVPFFMLAGEIMNVGGLSKRIVKLALTVVGHVPGGLGYVAIMAAVILAAVSGSAVADAAALASLLLPMMVAAGHNKERSAGLIASAGIINVAPPKRATRSELLLALREAVWALGLPIIILVGLRMGVFTPTEAAVVAAVYSLFVAMVVYRELSLRQLVEIFQTSARTSAVVMFLVAAAMVSAWLITVADLPSAVIGMLEPFMGNQTLLLIAIMVLVMVVGTAMDMTPTILILTPVLMPVVKAAGIDPVYFGVLFIINNAIGLITPPVGTVLNVVAGVGRISMSQVTRGVMPFMVAQFIVMFLLVLFPSIVLVPLRLLGG